MSKRTKALARDPEGFVIPEKLRGTPSPETDPNLKENWPISNNQISKLNFSRTQLQTRCRLFKTIRSALENPKQSKAITNSVFNQIRKGLFELPSHSSFTSSLKEIIKLILEGGGIPSVFLQSVSDWTGSDSAEKCLENLIFDLQDNNTSILQYYPIKPKKPSDFHFSEIFTDFFLGIGDALCKSIVKDIHLESISITCRWVKTIANASIRPLRHSGCVALNGILRSLISTKLELLEKLSRFKIQLENESPGTGAKESLEEELSKASKLCEKLDNLIKDIVSDSWISRAQDVSPDIRNNCLCNLSEGILQPHMANIVCESEIPSLLIGLLPEELNSNRIQILRSILICIETEEILKKCSVILTEKSFLRSLKNLVALASKLPSDSEVSSCGELALRVLIGLLKNELLHEEFVDEIVDLLWLGPSSAEISSLLAEFVDSSLFEGGISHENIESRELIDLANHQIDNKKIRSLMNLDGLKTLEPSRIRSDLQTLLEFIHEFGRDLVVLTHRCVNAFWSKAPCVRDSKFLVEMLLATECSSSSQLEPLDEGMRKALLLVLHANVSRIEDLLLMESQDISNSSYFKSESLLCKYRAFIVISVILEYMEPLILLHEQNIDCLTILLSIFSICISLYCRTAQDKENSSFIPSGMKHFPLKKLIALLNSHTDSRVIDGICMTFSPIVNLDCKNLLFNESSLIDIKSEIGLLNKNFVNTFFTSGREFLANTDGLLYSDVAENTSKSKKSKKSSTKPNNPQNSVLNTMCNFRKAFGVVKYLTTINIYLSNQFRDNLSSYKSSEMSPEQGSGVPLSFETLFEVLERAERIIQLNLDQILTHQCTQLYSLTLDMITTGYAHLVQDLLQGIDAESIDNNEMDLENNQASENSYLTLNNLKESTIDIYKAVRHKLSSILLESLRNNIKHKSVNNQCLNLISLLSMCSILVMMGLQGTVENNLQDPDGECEVKWSLTDSELALITKELIYWTCSNRVKNIDDFKPSKLSSSLIEGFNNILNFSDKDKPYYLLYPSCRIFEPLDNLKDESFVTTPETLDTYKNKLNDFLSHPFSPGCILAIISVSSQYKTTSQVFTPILVNYLTDIEDIMINNYYLETIQANLGSESNKERIAFSNNFIKFALFREGQENLGVFTCILICLIISYVQDNHMRAQQLSKKLFPTLSSRIGWKKLEELIKSNSSDLSRSILECLRFSLFGEISLPVFADIISRDELIEKSIKTKGIINLFLDFLTTQNAPGGKTVISTLSTPEIQRILDQAKALCDFDGKNSSSGGRLSIILNKELFDNDVMNFLDVISGQSVKKTSNKNKSSYKQTTNTDSEDNSLNFSGENNITGSSKCKYRPKRKRPSRASKSKVIYLEDDEDGVDFDSEIEDEIIEDSNSSDNENELEVEND
ncbi:nuclear protein SA-1 related protein [Cryptosporidium ubiquitum]|uniref:Nuclear protein SA-1 related protein n=1 Tax=Cryptosporidium ubiquitum TaxID=857276 RepID=A0A1J4MK20_9CRYT|nr:nuclear protein SA-1 related protein [Cryptosporidium ubiquitum]OII73189.1 nuclear protein SA-1 related protein [Cryptosporidium ubiquitum]